MQLGIENKVALVTAASKGLGKAAALALSAEGARVAIAARGTETLRAAAREIAQATGGTVLPVRADVSVAADLEALVTEVESAWGPVDILVNNAGGPRPGVFTDMQEQDWATAVELNLMSAIRLIGKLLPGMRARRWGRIINITSTAVKQPIPDLILSNTVRSGLVAMSKTLADQVAADGVTVNNVCPGYMDTDRVRALNSAAAQAQGVSVEEVLARTVAAIPAGRIGRPDELAALIAFLASEQAAYITGTTIQVDGGRYRGLM
ncbi:MAG: SDR family oxidoreductase [Anaerolineae bacterium]|nr:SDR family oxidoreductase [Chloroflexota bacterium]